MRTLMDDADVVEMIRAWLGSVQLMPDAYSEYSPLLIDGLVFFLQRLPPERLGDILSEQMELPESATPDERLVALLHHCPTLHKLGQVVAHETGLPLDLRRRLQSLESLAPPAGRYDTAALFADQLGRVPGLCVAPDALAEGSVAFVVPFEWNAPADLPRRGVFKALKPLAKERLAEDLEIWPALGEFLEERTLAYKLPSLDYSATLDGVARLLLNEIQLDQEQEQLSWAAGFYSGTRGVRIPQLLPFCTPNLTAMERIDGRKVTQTELGESARRELANTAIEALLAKPFWSSPSADVRFHADPHAGNLLAADEGGLVVLDWALTTRLDEAQTSGVVSALLGAATLDEPRVARAFAGLGRVFDQRALRTTVDEGLAQVRRGAFPGFEWLTALLDRLARSGSMRFPEATTLFRKSLLTLTGVAHDVSPRTSVDDVLIRSGAAQLMRETPGRALTPLTSRNFGSHLSNEDLLRLWAALPWTPTRYVVGSWFELLENLAAAGATKVQPG